MLIIGKRLIVVDTRRFLQTVPQLRSLGSGEGPAGKNWNTRDVTTGFCLTLTVPRWMSLDVIWLVGLLLLGIGGLWLIEWNAYARSPHAAFLNI